MDKFTKKPVAVRAFQMTKKRMTDKSDWPEWLVDLWRNEATIPCSINPPDGLHFERTDDLEIFTLEGSYHVGCDDWVIDDPIRGIHSLPPDVFDATYDDAND